MSHTVPSIQWSGAPAASGTGESPLLLILFVFSLVALTSIVWLVGRALEQRHRARRASLLVDRRDSVAPDAPRPRTPTSESRVSHLDTHSVERRLRAIGPRWTHGEIRWIFNAVCTSTGLIQVVVPVTGLALEPPRLAGIDLGPPTRLRIELRPGQLVTDLERARERFAAAFEVRDISIERRSGRWVLLELVDDHEMPAEALPSQSRVTPRPHGRRGRPGPKGGPRSLQ